jgi:hypothetical protein
MATARKPEMVEANALALSKIPMRNALSDGLYQKEKYKMQQGTAVS